MEEITNSLEERDHSLSISQVNHSQSLRQELLIMKYLGKKNHLDNNGLTMSVMDINNMYKNPKNDQDQCFPKISEESLDLVDSLYVQNITNMKNSKKEPKNSKILNNCVKKNSTHSTPNTMKMSLSHVL